MTRPARAFLHEALRAMYPRVGTDREFLVLPPVRRARLLVPAPRRLAAAAVRYGMAGGSWRSRLLRAGAAAAVRSGAAGALRPDRVRVASAGSIEAHLRELLDEEMALAIQVGAARANRKPVAQLLSPAGEPIGAVKLGTRALTGRLVRAETAALSALSRLRLAHLTVPRVRHAGAWNGHPLLVQSAVPAWRRAAAPEPHRLAPAMREVAHCLGVTGGPLGTSAYWKRLSTRVGELPPARGEEATLAAAVAAIGQRAGDLELRYGAWHGDWAPWNVAVLPDTVVVWDWERFTVGVPLGFDALHYELQRQLAAGPALAAEAVLAAVDPLLAPFGVPPAARRLTALLYLADLATRYLADRQAEAGAPLGVLGGWLLPVLQRHLRDLP